MAVEVGLPFERPLYAPVAAVSRRLRARSRPVTATSRPPRCSTRSSSTATRCARTVRRRCATVPRSGSAPLVADHPLEHGLAELIGYLSLTDPAFDVVFDEQHRDEVGWRSDEAERGRRRPRVTFTRQYPGGQTMSQSTVETSELTPVLVVS